MFTICHAQPGTRQDAWLIISSRLCRQRGGGQPPTADGPLLLCPVLPVLGGRLGRHDHHEGNHRNHLSCLTHLHPSQKILRSSALCASSTFTLFSDSFPSTNHYVVTWSCISIVWFSCFIWIPVSLLSILSLDERKMGISREWTKRLCVTIAWSFLII